MTDYIFLPVPRNLYDDVVRFSDGKCDLIDLAIDQFHDFIRRTAEDNAHGLMGDRLDEFLAIYHPDVLAHLHREDEEAELRDAGRMERLSPLVWKEVEVPAGSEVRMQYGGAYHTAKVLRGRIVDQDGDFSPSEWASKVAQGTNRNAWRDLYFRFPGMQQWNSATTLRDLRRQELRSLVDVDINTLLKDL
jgi:hypothetical protein